MNEIKKYSRSDWFYAMGIFLFVFVLAACQVTTGFPDWGDDHSAYITEGIAIAENRLDEQAGINHFLHPGNLTEESDDGKLIYAWGYPLMQAGIYKLVGFDRVNYSSVVWYKIPMVLSLALLGGVLFLFFRRRFSPLISAVLAVLLCLSGDLFGSVNKLYSDLPFVFLAFLAFLLMECYTRRPGGVLAAVYGIALWMAYETRLNGMTVCAVAFLGHILSQGREFISKKRFWKNIIPYAIFIVLVLVTEKLWLAPATQNISDIGTVTVETVLKNLYYYADMVIRFFSTLAGPEIRPLGFIVTALCVIGFVKKGWGRNFYLSVLMIGSFVVLALLPYTQGLRYLYNVLPILLMFAAYGALAVGKWAAKLIGDRQKNLRTAGTVAAYAVVLVMLVSSCAYQAIRDVKNISGRGAPSETDVYSEDAVEMYGYIQENVPQDAVIAFTKPRSLYLNTGRLSFRAGHNGHELTDADYMLFFKLDYGNFPELTPDDALTELVKENKWFGLYKIVKE